jgi:hypothetical protein
MTTETPTPLADWIHTAWDEHAADAEGVMSRFGESLGLVTEAKDLAPLATLMTHVAANHLGRYEDGLALMDKLSALGVFEAGEANSLSVARCKAMLYLCMGDNERAAAFEGEGHPEELPRASTSIRVCMAAAGALGQQGQAETARSLYLDAIQLAAYGPVLGDPAAGALAMNSNNMACELEVRESRTAEDDELLELAAKTARRYWEVAGSWVQVKIAEYRLAMTYIALGNGDLATEHAKLALAICDANEAADEERFFPLEALARARFCAGDSEGAKAARARAASALEAASEGNREWFAGSLVELDRFLG